MFNDRMKRERLRQKPGSFPDYGKFLLGFGIACFVIFFVYALLTGAI